MVACNGISWSGLFEIIGEVVIEGDCVTRTQSYQFRMATLPTSEAAAKYVELHGEHTYIAAVRGPAAYVARHKKLAAIKAAKQQVEFDASVPF